jgi:hypothetical protein
MNHALVFMMPTADDAEWQQVEEYTYPHIHRYHKTFTQKKSVVILCKSFTRVDTHILKHKNNNIRPRWGTTEGGDAITHSIDEDGGGSMTKLDRKARAAEADGAHDNTAAALMLEPRHTCAAWVQEVAAAATINAVDNGEVEVAVGVREGATSALMRVVE